MEANLKFGLRGDDLIHVGDVERGLSCDCVCPSCKHPLVAKKGRVKTHHFAHYGGSDCAMAVETALHLMAKQILAREQRLFLPPVNVEFNSYREPIQVANSSVVPLDVVAEEHRIGGIVADIYAESNGTPLIIEIMVTHAVDEMKLVKIRKLNISALEVDLSEHARDTDRDMLSDALLNDTDNKSWLFNAESEILKRILLDAGERKQTIARGFALHVDYCPIDSRIWRGKPYANVIDDCLNCRYALHVYGTMSAIHCGGKDKIETFDDIKRLIARQANAKTT